MSSSAGSAVDLLTGTLRLTRPRGRQSLVPRGLRARRRAGRRSRSALRRRAPEVSRTSRARRGRASWHTSVIDCVLFLWCQAWYRVRARGKITLAVMRSLQCRPNRNWRHVAILILAASNVLALGQSKKPVNFESDILPIFQASCVPCHGSTVKMKDLDLSTLAGVMKGSDAGPVMEPGNPDESRLYKMVQTGAMPKGGKPLAEDRVAVIREWIEGAEKSPSAAV